MTQDYVPDLTLGSKSEFLCKQVFLKLYSCVSRFFSRFFNQSTFFVQLQNAPKDEFGVTHLNLIYSEDEDKMYCFLEAPDKEAIKKHHDKFGYKCDYILEVNSTGDDQSTFFVVQQNLTHILKGNVLANY